MWLLTSFSLQMLEGLAGTVRFSPMDEASARELLRRGFQSAVGHEDTADILSARFGFPVALNRVRVTLRPRDAALVAQLAISRTPQENAVITREQVEQAKTTFVLVRVLDMEES